MASVAQLINAYARRYGLDPRAVRAVAMGEGGLRWGAVGDQGTSYGPFQLHRGGALPRGKSAAWANSPAGLEYAIRSMSQAGARGLSGRAAIEAIIRKFERPAAPEASIAKALGRYGQPGGGTAPAAGAGGAALPLSGPAAAPGIPARQQFAQALLEASRTGQRNLTPAIDLLRSLQQAQAPVAQTPGPMPAGAQQGAGGAGGPSSGALTELIYGPMGAIYDGRPGKPAPGHERHIHAAASNPQAMLAIIAEAQRRGLAVRENPYVERVDPVHTKGSWHYQNFPGRYQGKRLGKASDISGGSARDRSKFYSWLKTHYG